MGEPLKIAPPNRMPVILRDPFQLGYVVRSLEGALRTMRERWGVTQWKIHHLPPTAPGRALAFAYAGKMMIELIDIRPEEDTIYRAWIPQQDNGLRLHHLGYLIEEDDEWPAQIARLEEAGLAAAMVGGIPGRMEWYYSDTVAMLGHYTELVRFTSQVGRTYWADVPHN